MILHDYDYIILGAGSAGCVLANRLSLDPSNKVLLIRSWGYRSSFLYPNAYWIWQDLSPKSRQLDVYD